MKYPLYRNELCPKLWHVNEDGIKLDDAVRKGLLKIAQDFVDNLKKDNNIDIKIHDIVIIGSITNYNWTDYSDIDLHVVTDYKNLDMTADDAQTLFDAIKVSWNNKHDITMKGHDVEIYVQDKSHVPTSASSYSALNNDWIQEPIKEKPTFNKDLIKKKYKEYKNKITTLLSKHDETALKSLLDKLYKYRQSGLDSGGELSEENIVFKILRAHGYLEKVKDNIAKTYDKKMSVDEAERISDGIWPILGPNEEPPKKGKEKIEINPDGDSSYDELVPTDKQNNPEMRQVFGIQVYPAFQVTTGVETLEAGSEMLTAIRHALKHPIGNEQKELVKKLAVQSVDELSTRVDLKSFDVIIPLGSSSGLNLLIADLISKKSGGKVPVLKGLIVKDIWRNVQVRPRMPADVGKNPSKKQVAAYTKTALERDRGYQMAAAHLATMKKENPDDPFEIKNTGGVGRSLRQYYTLFYKTEDGYSIDLTKKITGGNVLIIDDTLEGATTLVEAIRVINGFKPRECIAYIFLYGRYGGSKTNFRTKADIKREKNIAAKSKKA